MWARHGRGMGVIRLSVAHATLTIICGPMFAGKTTELIRRVADSRARGLIVRVFKPARDDRYHETDLTSHTGERLPATPIREAATAFEGADVGTLIVLDEAHFFGSSLVAPVREAIQRGQSVVLAGVDLDHRGEPFEPFPVLMCEADEVVKLRATCEVCGGPAVHSQRMTAAGDRIVVGGSEMYQARCRTCFQPGR